AATRQSPGRAFGLPIAGGFRGRRARGLARAWEVLREARSRGWPGKAGPLRLIRSVPEPNLRRDPAGRLAARVQLRPPERGAPGPRRGARAGTPARRGALGARPHRPRRCPVEAQVRTRIPRPGIHDGDRVGALDPLRPLRGAPVRPLRRRRRRQRDLLHKLETCSSRRSCTLGCRAAHSPPPGWTDRSVRAARQPAGRV
ncbi:MAG: hypothetical protein AVDCRST_MAG78-401, partial [uncultured Rubrobacteraceae bacterium]